MIQSDTLRNRRGEVALPATDALEERINTLLTKDPNKIKVYTDGFDGHSFRAVSYWPDQFHDIDPTDPIQVNAIAKTEHGSKLRQKSKGPTFAF